MPASVSAPTGAATVLGPPISGIGATSLSKLLANAAGRIVFEGGVPDRVVRQVANVATSGGRRDVGDVLGAVRPQSGRFGDPLRTGRSRSSGRQSPA